MVNMFFPHLHLSIHFFKPTCVIQKLKDAALAGLLNLIRMSDYLLTLICTLKPIYNTADCKQNTVSSSLVRFWFLCDCVFIWLLRQKKIWIFVSLSNCVPASHLWWLGFTKMQSPVASTCFNGPVWTGECVWLSYYVCIKLLLYLICYLVWLLLFLIKKNKQFKKTEQLKKDPKFFLMSVKLPFHISLNVLSPPKVKDNSWLKRIQLDFCQFSLIMQITTNEYCLPHLGPL